MLRSKISGVIFCLLSCQATMVVRADPHSPAKTDTTKWKYRVEWRMVTAGAVELDVARGNVNSYLFNLKIASAGFVTRLYRVEDNYRVTTDDKFCAINTTLDAQEGKRHKTSRIQVQNDRRKLRYEERDLIANQTVTKDLDIAPCTHEIAGALAWLRRNRIEPGRTITLPMTDGKKMVQAKVESQAKETIKVEGQDYQALRYEAFLFDNVLYHRKGRLFIWVTDDDKRLPIQIKLRFGFPIYSISLYLQNPTT